MTEDVKRFESLEMLDVSPFERYDAHKKRVYRHTSQRLSGGMAGMVVFMNRDMNDNVIESNVQVSKENNRRMSIQNKLKEEK